MPKRKTDLVRRPMSPAEIAADLIELTERAEKQVEFSAAENTRIGYGTDMRQFVAWCEERGAVALPCVESVLSKYLAHMERLGLTPSTIDRKLAGIVKHHRANGHPSPRSALITEQLKGIKRGTPERRPKPQKQAPPLMVSDLARMVEVMNDPPPRLLALAIRDKAALLVGWACAMRRSEVVGLDIDDVEHVREGWKIWIRKSKTDQLNKGIALALAPAEKNKKICPVLALEQWLEVRKGDAATQPPGGLFWKGDLRTRVAKLVPENRMPWVQFNQLISRWCKVSGLAASNGLCYSPHSLRAGFITESIQNGKPIAETRNRSRHASMDQFFKYVRIAMTFENNVQKGLM